MQDQSTRLCACGCGETIPAFGPSGHPRSYVRGHARRRDAVLRFWDHVDKSGECWIWTGYCQPKGYGLFYPADYHRQRNNRTTSAHRYSYELHFGPIPSGMSVCHRCDNPPCVRPDHLWLGTNGDNVRDMYAKGRGGYRGMPGSLHPSAKLTERDVYDMRAKYRRLVNDLAADYGVTRVLVRQILAGKSWQHIA